MEDNTSLQFTKGNAQHTLKVIGFLAVSGALTALVDVIPHVDLGNWNVIVMAVINTAIVAIKEWLTKYR